MPYENFTLYTDIDPFSRTVITAASVVATGVTRDEDTRVIDDKGAGYFSRNFTHTFEASMNNNNLVGNVSAWGMSNTDDDLFAIIGADLDALYGLFSDGQFYYLGESVAGGPYSDFATGLSQATTYYENRFSICMGNKFLRR
jgi:hypothetical protein